LKKSSTPKRLSRQNPRTFKALKGWARCQPIAFHRFQFNLKAGSHDGIAGEARPLIKREKAHLHSYLAPFDDAMGPLYLGTGNLFSKAICLTDTSGRKKGVNDGEWVQN
jgi:hypothetical protein